MCVYMYSCTGAAGEYVNSIHFISYQLQRLKCTFTVLGTTSHKYVSRVKQLLQLYGMRMTAALVLLDDH